MSKCTGPGRPVRISVKASGRALTRSSTLRMRQLFLTIGVNSEHGVGSTFWFELVLPVDEAAMDNVQPDAGVTDGLGVLVVTTDAAHRKVLTDQLSAWGIWPVSADTAAQALDMARRAVAQGRPFHVAFIAAALG